MAEKPMSESYLWKQHARALQNNRTEICRNQTRTQADSRQVCLESLHNHFKPSKRATPRIPPSLKCLFSRSTLKPLGSIWRCHRKESKCQFACGWWIVFFTPALQWLQQRAMTLRLSVAVMKSDARLHLLCPYLGIVFLSDNLWSYCTA